MLMDPEEVREAREVVVVMAVVDGHGVNRIAKREAADGASVWSSTYAAPSFETRAKEHPEENWDNQAFHRTDRTTTKADAHDKNVIISQDRVAIAASIGSGNVNKHVGLSGLRDTSALFTAFDSSNPAHQKLPQGTA